MKRLLFGLGLLGVGAVLAGCPIYSNSGNYRVCTSQGCYDCPDPSLSSACIEWPCGSDADCGDGYTCSPNNTCVANLASPDAGPPSVTGTCWNPSQCAEGWVCGTDGNCHPGQCSYWGCPAGYSCFSSQCISVSTAVDAGSPPRDSGTIPATDASFDASPFDGGFVSPFDASPDASFDSGVSHSDAASEASAPMTLPCNDDGQCGGGGARCIDGQCTPQSGLCSDGTQCPGGESCVDGECTPHCSASAPCPIGFGCDVGRGVCGSVNATVCASKTDCLGGTVCVEDHCVAPCAADDSGASCPAGELCVNGGCIPNQAATFACKNDGYTGQVANSCSDTNDICLHGDCYAECDMDGSTCTAPDVCKQVTTAQGTFAVCGPASELGSQCDPAAGTYCPPGGECIDGYCR